MATSKVKTVTDPEPVPSRLATTIDCSAKAHGHKITKDSFADECDVNKIVERMQRGIPPHIVNLGTPQYGDFADVDSFQTALNNVRAAQEAFQSLPATIRARMDNDPAKLLAFLSDDSNKPEAIELGLLEAPEPEPRRHPDPEPNPDRADANHPNSDPTVNNSDPTVNKTSTEPSGG